MRDQHPIRLIRSIAVVLTAAMLATGCGDLRPDSLAYAGDETNVAAESVVRIATPRVNGLERAIDDWEREHPTARVEVVVRNIDDHHQSILDDAGAGGQFDIVAFDAAFSPAVRRRPDLFVDLRSLGGEASRSDHLEARWDEGVAQGGELLGLPIDVDSIALAVRTDLVPPDLIDRLTTVSTWCELIEIGDVFSDRTGTAFLPDGDDVFTTMLAQNRFSFVDEAGTLDADQLPSLETAWDLTMLTIGKPSLHGTPCPGENRPDHNEIARISRNLPAGSDQWRTQLRDGGYAAMFARYSELRRITIAAPETAGNWTIVALPGTASASSGGIHLGVSANSSHRALAYDLISYLADPSIQLAAFAGGTGPFPAAAVTYDNPAITNYTDPFFGDTPIGAIYVDGARRRPKALAEPERQIVIDAFTAAINRVEIGNQTPAESWDEALWRIGQFLS